MVEEFEEVFKPFHFVKLKEKVFSPRNLPVGAPMTKQLKL